MKELDVINRYLGGHAITVNAFKQLAGQRKQLTVCEIGCGGGDNLLAIYRWCEKNNIKVSFIGIDIKNECIAFAKSRNEINAVTNWITNDYKSVDFKATPDIIFSSLFCHHFTDEELVLQLQWMKNNSAIGFFINDLHRNSLAYYSIKALTKIFSSSYLVKNDAPLSVARGFSKSELKEVCVKSNLPNVKIIWKWAFRYLVIQKHDTGKVI
jgi:2-polyprenyl-3-methyl-5-hydroxy-6-metoxy-1,4-benzoquinol methylase